MIDWLERRGSGRRRLLVVGFHTVMVGERSAEEGNGFVQDETRPAGLCPAHAWIARQSCNRLTISQAASGLKALIFQLRYRPAVLANPIQRGVFAGSSAPLMMPHLVAVMLELLTCSTMRNAELQIGVAELHAI
jgi:hypothetical protein